MAKGFYYENIFKTETFRTYSDRQKSAFSLVYIKFLNNHLLSVTTIEKTKKQNK